MNKCRQWAQSRRVNIKILHPDVSGSIFSFGGAGGFFKSLSFSLLIQGTGQITSLISRGCVAYEVSM